MYETLDSDIFQTCLLQTNSISKGFDEVWSLYVKSRFPGKFEVRYQSTMQLAFTFFCVFLTSPKKFSMNFFHSSIVQQSH